MKVKNCGLIINEEKLIGQKLDSIGKNISIARKIQIKDSTNFITDLTELSHNFKHPHGASTNIYIDDASNILPHPNELFFLGKLDDVKDSDFLKKNKQYLFYLKHNRTVNYKCKTCEYNFYVLCLFMIGKVPMIYYHLLSTALTIRNEVFSKMLKLLIKSLALLTLLITSTLVSANNYELKCDFKFDDMLKMSPRNFDQDFEKGWVQVV